MTSSSNTDLIRLTIQITPQQKAALQHLSKHQRIPISIIIRQLLRERFPDD